MKFQELQKERTVHSSRRCSIYLCTFVMTIFADDTIFEFLSRFTPKKVYLFKSKIIHLQYLAKRRVVISIFRTTEYSIPLLLFYTITHNKLCSV